MRRSFWRAGGLALGLMLASVPGAYHSAVAQSALRAGALDFRDLSFNGQFGSGKIGLVSFSGLAQEGDRVRADKVRIEGLTWQFMEASIDIPSVSIDDFEGPRSLVDALSGGASAVDWIAVINTARADRIAIDRMEQKLGGTAAASGTLTGLALEGLDDGLLTALRFAAWEFEATVPPNSETVRWKVGATHYDDVNLAETARFVTGGGSGPAKQLVRFAASEGLESSSTDGTRMRIGSTETRGYYARAPREALTIADLKALETIKDNGNPALAKKLATYVTELIDNTRIESATLSNWEQVFPGGTAKIAAMTVGNYGLVGFDLFELAGLEIEAPTGPVRINRIALEKMDYRATADYMLDALRSGSPPATDFARIRDALPSLGAFRIESMSATTPEGPVSFGSFAIESERSGSILTAITTTLKRLDLKIDGGTPNDAKERLIALGYPEILADAQFVLRYDETKKTSSNTVAFSMDEAGSVETTLRVDGVDIEKLVEAREEAAALAMQTQLGGLEIKIVDLGIAQRFFQSIADGAGVSADAIRDGLAAEIRTQATALLGPALAPGSADKIGDFLRNSGTLILRVAPRSDRPPLLLGEVQAMDPPQLADRLTVTIEAVGK